MPHLVLTSLLVLLAHMPDSFACETAPAQAKLLAERTWLTTAVYEGNDRTQNHIARYPGVVGISIWDACTNRFEYFDPATGRSRREQGGAGGFYFTGDRRYQYTVPDTGTPLRRRMEVLSASEFTYSRQVPRGMREGEPLVTVHVVHTPYRGPWQVTATSRAESP
ncbi:DUF4822 domain-containing protein [Stenotrophomonas rhizophila]